MIEQSGNHQGQQPSQQVFNQAPLDDDDSIDLDFLIAAVQRQWKVVAASAAIGLVLGLAYLLSATPLYTSSTRILYDQSQGKAVDELTDISGVFGDQSEFESQLELIKSERIANKVVDNLNLHLSDDFLDEGTSGIGAVISTIKSVVDVTSWFSDVELSQAEIDGRKRSAAKILQDNVSVSRIKRTYIIELNYRSEAPARSKQIAAAFAKSYLDDQLDSKYDATRRAGEWLQTRIAELKDQSLAADLAVQRFKAENNLINSGGTGQNLAEAQLAGANAQLIAAKGQVAERKAQFDKLNSAIESGDLSVAVDASLDSQIITSMREKFLDLSKQHAEFLAKLGAKHVKVITLRNEMAEYQRLMFEELGRIRDSSKGEYEIAVEREKALQVNLTQMISETASANKEQVRLRELEREAATYKALLENFLQKYQESIQQQSFPVNDARVIELAKNPENPSHPRKGMSLALSLILGGMIGTGIGAFREFRERFFRTGDQIRDALNLEFLGLIPKIDPTNSWAAK
ncbi:MAG: GumC family protein, partial [Cohaesibacter sp.]|nr:GumC family protein [Cohaesibacter sp.]